MSTCKYPGCDHPDDSRPYARKRDGIPSASKIAGLLDMGKSRGFAWAASLVAAGTAVHESERWFHMPTHPCSRDKKGLCRACNFLRSEHDRQWAAKAALGQHVHHMALQWAQGEEVETDAKTDPYMSALESFYKDCQPQFVELERTVRGSFNGTAFYRGQFDFIARLDRDGQRRLGLWDIKTGSFHPVEQTLQLAGYRYADWLTTWGDGTEARACPMGPVDEAGVLMLHNDGTYDLIELPADRAAFGLFRQLLGAYHWANHIEDRFKKERGAS